MPQRQYNGLADWPIFNTTSPSFGPENMATSTQAGGGDAPWATVMGTYEVGWVGGRGIGACLLLYYGVHWPKAGALWRVWVLALHANRRPGLFCQWRTPAGQAWAAYSKAQASLACRQQASHGEVRPLSRPLPSLAGCQRHRQQHPVPSQPAGHRLHRALDPAGPAGALGRLFVQHRQQQKLP